jgi:hypothetical protein
MHKSRLANIVIDCRTEALDQAAEFWSKALGRPWHTPPDPGDANYRELGPVHAIFGRCVAIRRGHPLGAEHGLGCTPSRVP